MFFHFPAIFTVLFQIYSCTQQILFLAAVVLHHHLLLILQVGSVSLTYISISYRINSMHVVVCPQPSEFSYYVISCFPIHLQCSLLSLRLSFAFTHDGDAIKEFFTFSAISARKCLFLSFYVLLLLIRFLSSSLTSLIDPFVPFLHTHAHAQFESILATFTRTYLQYLQIIYMRFKNQVSP